MSNPLSDDYFMIDKTLGSGAFSTVFLGRSKTTGRQYALKRLIWTLSPQRIVKEVHFMKKLNHPSIVKFLSFYCQEEQVTLVLEYLPHVPFRELFPILTPHQVKLYMFQLLSALSHCHANHIIHRDVKPSNFLFDPITN
jgi:serine/threonine protein kinase